MKKRHTSRNLKTNPGRYERFTPRRKAENNGRILSSLSEITKTELNAVHLRINEIVKLWTIQMSERILHMDLTGLNQSLVAVHRTPMH